MLYVNYAKLGLQELTHFELVTGLTCLIGHTGKPLVARAQPYCVEASADLELVARTVILGFAIECSTLTNIACGHTSSKSSTTRLAVQPNVLTDRTDNGKTQHLLCVEHIMTG